MEKPLMDKKRLAPLNEGGPAQLLQLQIQKLEQENTALKLRIKTVTLDSRYLMTEGVNDISSRWKVRRLRYWNLNWA